MGRFSKIAGEAGVGLPADDRRTAGDALAGFLELSRSQESRARQLACKNLCTCHVRADDGRVWARLLELAEDPDPLVRRDVIHALTDSTPSLRVPAVIGALESRRNDPDERIRRQVPETLAHYRRTGKGMTDRPRKWPPGSSLKRSGPTRRTYALVGHKVGHTGSENGPPDHLRRAVLPGSGGRI